MASTKRATPGARAKTKAAAARTPQPRTNRTPWIVGAVLVALAVGGLYLAFRAGTDDGTSTPASADYAVGTPGPGAQAPDFTLPATSGGSVSLSDYTGETTLLYFHEGLGCQPCWDQIRDLEQASGQLTTAGIDELVTITTGPVDLIAQKMGDAELTAVALVDTDMAVSREYEANKYGMMGDSRDGHSFILVGPDGAIQWRADYGGAPNYTMYVPVQQILDDLAAARQSP